MKRIVHGNVYIVASEYEKKLPLYLTHVGGWDNQYSIYREHGWADFQWIQCTKGEGMLKIYEEEHRIGPGQGMLLFPNEFHNYYALTEPWEVRWFSFNGKQALDILRSFQFKRSQVLLLSDPEPVLSKMDDLIRFAVPDLPTNYLDCSAIVYHILLDLFRYGTISDTRSRQQYLSQLSPALQYIEEHFHEPISLDHLARILDVSHHHTCVLFRQTLDLRPFQYVNHVRVRKARELLIREPSLSIGEVAVRVGYENQSYFIKMFKRYQGLTPRKYREQA